MKDSIAKALAGIRSLVRPAQRDDRNSRETVKRSNAPDTKDHGRDNRDSQKKRVTASSANVPTTKDGEQRYGHNSRETVKQDTRYISDSVRQEVFERDGYKCKKCGSTSYLEFDHIIPRARGGATSAKNLQVLCRQCNRKKGER